MTTKLLTCSNCKIIFSRRTAHVNRSKRIRHTKNYFCSHQCQTNWRRSQKVIRNCLQCNIQIMRKGRGNSKDKLKFCSHSCAATYNNSHKKYGTRRSKIEIYIESQIKSTYPQITLNCNDQSFGYELDFYIPTLKLAIELNGPVHYEPIYGTEKFERIQYNDKQKLLKCATNGIELAVIDISQIHYLTQERKDYVWNLVKSVIKPNLNRAK